MKRLIKTVLLLFGSIIAKDKSPKVVFYHDIGKKWTTMGTDVDVFISHIKLLRKGDVVCFDDGFRGLWDNREILSCEERINHVILFLAVALIGREGYLTWDEIRTLQKEYGIEVQCHTWSHQTLIGPWNYEVSPPTDGRTDGWYKHELLDSKKEIERHLGKAVTALCFPVGYFSDDIVSRCRAVGYKKVYASYPGNITNDYVQPRCIAQDLGKVAFRAVLNGGMSIFAKRYKEIHCSH